MADVPSVSVIVVTYNSAAEIAVCLRSLKNVALRIPLEVIVVDNQSGDDTLAIALNAFPEVRVLPQNRNHGFGRAINIGAAVAKGRYLLVLNPDTEVLNALVICKLYEALETRPELTAAGCRLLRSPSEIQPFSFSLPNIKMIVAQLTGVRRILRIPGVMQVLKRLKLGGGVSTYLHGVEFSGLSREVAFLSGACFLIRTQQFKEICGFDESYFLYMEDCDLFFRMRQKGFRSLLVQDLGVVHAAGASFDRSFTRISPRKYWSTLYYFRKNHPLWEYHLIRIVMGLTVIASGLRHFASVRTFDRYCRDAVAVVQLCWFGHESYDPFPH